MKTSKKEIGQLYRQHAIELLARLGYATTRQLAKTVFGSTQESKKKMLGRTMRWLVAHGLVASKRLPVLGVGALNSETIYALTEAGAAVARSFGTALPNKRIHGRDYMRHAHPHRTACNSVFCATRHMAFSELEIRAEEAPLNRVAVHEDGKVKFHKIPDLIVQLAGDSRLIWVEVENTYRSAEDLTKMIETLREMYNSKASLKLARVDFVVTNPSAKRIAERLREKLLYEAPDDEKRVVPVLLKELDKKIFNSFIGVSILDTETLTLQAVSLTKTASA